MVETDADRLVQGRLSNLNAGSFGTENCGSDGTVVARPAGQSEFVDSEERHGHEGQNDPGFGFLVDDIHMAIPCLFWWKRCTG